jgi:hypothetical protein
VAIGRNGSEELLNRFGVCDKLGSSEGKDIEHGINEGVPSDCPLGMGSDNLSRSGGTRDDFQGFETLSSAVVRSNEIQPGENMVEIDNSSSKNAPSGNWGSLEELRRDALANLRSRAKFASAT